MLIIPTVDIIGGKCVRLSKKDMNASAAYGGDPADVARGFEQQGARFLHVVDIDGAEAGFPVNRSALVSVLKAVKIPVQIGGGIRSYGQAREYLESGAERIVLSTIVIEDPQLIERLISSFGESRIIISADVKEGKIATHGWSGKSSKSVEDVVPVLKKAGVSSVIAMDISKNGILKGPNFKLPGYFVSQGFKTMASGGVSSVDDIKKLDKLGVCGVVVGRAMHEGKINLSEVNKLFDK